LSLFSYLLTASVATSSRARVRRLTTIVVVATQHKIRGENSLSIIHNSAPELKAAFTREDKINGTAHDDDGERLVVIIR